MTVMIPAWIDGELVPVEKIEAHRRGLRHKAVSVFLYCGDEILIQRRAREKYHSPGLWANACCSHPNWGETSQDCAGRRLSDELGLTNMQLEYRGCVEYRADVGSGMIEHESVDIFVGTLSEKPSLDLDPDEVDEVAWVAFDRLEEMVRRQPAIFAQWFVIYVNDHAGLIGP